MCYAQTPWMKCRVMIIFSLCPKYSYLATILKWYIWPNIWINILKSNTDVNYFRRDPCHEGDIVLDYVSTEYQLINIFMKALSKTRFATIRALSTWLIYMPKLWAKCIVFWGFVLDYMYSLTRMFTIWIVDLMLKYWFMSFYRIDNVSILRNIWWW